MRKSVVLLCFMLLSASVVFGDDLKKYLGEGAFVIEGKINDYPDFQDEDVVRVVVGGYLRHHIEEIPIKKDGTFKTEIPVTDIQNVSFYTGRVSIEFFSFKNDTVKITWQHDKPLETIQLSGTSKNRNLDLELCLALSQCSTLDLPMMGMIPDPSFTDSVWMEKLNRFYKDQIETIRAFQEKNGDTDFTGKIITDAYFRTCYLAVSKRALLPAIIKDIDYQNRYNDYAYHHTLDQNVFRTSSIYRDYIARSIFHSLSPYYYYYSYTNLNLYGDDNDEAENKISRLKREYYAALFLLSDVPSIRDWYITKGALGAIYKSEPDEIQDFLDDFKAICKNKTYISALEDLYSDILNLYAASSAPDFTLKNEKGKLVSLSDFKGRIVYLYFWNGVSCGSCTNEFSYFDKKFHEKYKSYDIVHMYVCFSNDENRWKEDIKKYDLQGINLIAEEKKDNPFYKNYVFYGCPHYVLIGKDGRVYKNNCESPSGFLNQDGNLLDELINNGL